MEGPVLRLNRPEDQPALQALWRAVYHDTPEVIDTFFRFYGGPGTAVLLEASGSLATAMYMLPIDGFHLPDGTVRRVNLFYALATEPAFRYWGYGTQVMGAGIRQGYENGAECQVLWPAEEWLFSYYSKVFGYRNGFCVRETAVSSPAILPQPGGLYPTSPEEYDRFRNRFLSEHVGTFLQFGPRAIAFQQALCGLSGGGCCLLGESAAPWGAVICEYADSETLAVKELLCPDSRIAEALSALAAAYPAEAYQIRTPADLGASLGGEVRRCGQIHTPESCDIARSLPGYYGPAFD